MRHVNYKSDFVLRETFRSARGETTSLPDVDFTMRYWVKPGRIFEASRTGGVYTNCCLDGECLLVMFKDHNLGEGVLKHELRLSLDNELFQDGKQTVFYPAELELELWRHAGDTDNVIESDLIAAYTRGNPFTFADFTPEQLASLKGEPFRFKDFTPAQIEDLKRPAKEAGEKADKAALKATDAAKEAGVATKQCQSTTAECQKITILAGEASAKAQSSSQAAEQTRTKLEQMGEQVKAAASNIPTGLRISYPKRITLRNKVKQYITAVVKPDYALQNVLFLTDGNACKAEPNGELVAVAPGTSRIHVIPTNGVQYYKTISVKVEKPVARMAGNMFRLDADGNIRLT